MNGNGQAHARRAEIPGFLQRVDRWGRWHTDNDRKRPFASTKNRDAWGSLAEHADTPVDATRGLGLCLTDGVEHEGRRIIALDIDACRQPKTGAVERWAVELVASLDNTYTEITTSGTGLRSWVLVDETPRTNLKIRVPYAAPEGVTKRPEIQFFGAGPPCYVTVTGNALPGCAPEPQPFADLDFISTRFGYSGIGDEDHGTASLPMGVGAPVPYAEIESKVLADPRGRSLLDGHWEHVKPDDSASEAWPILVRLVARAANMCGETTVAFLLDQTAWGRGDIDSREPGRYMRRSWVARDVARLLSKMGEKAPDAHFEIIEGDPPPVVAAPPVGRIVDWPTFREGKKGSGTLFKTLLPRVGLGQVFGDPGSGKTPVALSMALHAALELDWHGHRFNKGATDEYVLYMVGEDAYGIRNRIEAQCREMGAESPGRLLLTEEPGALCDRDDAERWVKELREKTRDRASLVVVDTQNANFGDGDENDTRDSTRFVANLKWIADQLRCCVLLVHHTGHANKDRARGSIVVHGALDAAYRVERDEHSKEILLVTRKAKNWEEPAPKFLDLVVHTVGRDEDGDDVTAVCLGRDDRQRPNPGQVFEELTEAERTLHELLLALHALGGAASVSALATRLDVSTSTARARAGRACDLRLARKTGRTKTTRIHLTEEGKEYTGVALLL